MANGAEKKNLEIEVLRGIAVLLTMLSHLTFLFPFHAERLLKIFGWVTPWTGVDLFFCISGYVVSKSYMEKFDEFRRHGLYWLSLQGFFIRRIYRLLPSAWLWAVFGLICSATFNRSGVFATVFDNVRSLGVILTFSGNYANQYGLLLHPNHHYWSLALEEQFYLIFPVFLLFIKSTRWRIGWLSTLVAVQFVLNRNTFGTPAQAMMASFRLDAVMWGILIYMFSRSQAYRYFEPTLLRGMFVRVLAVAVLLYLLVAIPAQLIALPTAVGMVALVAALLIFLASFNRGYIPPVPLLSTLLVWIGARSYGIYLIHVFIYRFVYELFTRYAEHAQVKLDGTFTVPMMTAALVMVFVLAALNYRFLEVPLRNRGSAIARRREQRIFDELSNKQHG